MFTSFHHFHSRQTVLISFSSHLISSNRHSHMIFHHSHLMFRLTRILFSHDVRLMIMSVSYGEEQQQHLTTMASVEAGNVGCSATMALDATALLLQWLYISDTTKYHLTFTVSDFCLIREGMCPQEKRPSWLGRPWDQMVQSRPAQCWWIAPWPMNYREAQTELSLHKWCRTMMQRDADRSDRRKDM